MAGSCFSMARKLRLEYPEAIYHKMKRGDRQKPTLERPPIPCDYNEKEEICNVRD